MERLKHKTTVEIAGIAASPGIAIGKAYVIKKSEIIPTGILLDHESDILKEIQKFDKAVQTSVDDIKGMKDDVNLKLRDEEIEILEMHIEFLTDPQIREEVFKKIKIEKKNVTDAVIEVIDKTVQTFKNMDDQYMSERAADLQDIGEKILKNLNRSVEKEIQKFHVDAIIIAEDISPSDMISMDMSKIVGFATHVGGKTSHTAIVAKSKNIPAVVGCADALKIIENNDVIIIDGQKGIVIINPSEYFTDSYRIQKETYNQNHNLLSSLKDTVAKTSDGVEITMFANIANADEMEASLGNGAEGAGLLRTELLFMHRDSFPSEEEQFEFYKDVALKSQSKPVIVRTIDIGGDKQLKYFNIDKEENPFLGYRAIRICLDRTDIFITQLKAILKASVYGNLRIMFPMISNIQELRLAKAILEKAKKELRDNRENFDEKILTGIMIEVPSAALTADLFAKEVDFFSIGTNDLCQYTLAVDRGNEKIKDLYDPYNPAVLRLIRYVIEQGHKHHINVGMCGELASDPHATTLLMGMGLKEFSMSSSLIPAIKDIIMSCSYSKAKEVCEHVMTMDNSKSIIDYLQLQR